MTAPQPAVWHFGFVTDAFKIACGTRPQFSTSNILDVTCSTCLASPLLPPLGVAPCGNTYGTVAGPNDGVTRCCCGVVHPIDPRVQVPRTTPPREVPESALRDYLTRGDR